MNELRQDHIIRFIAAFRRGRIEAREHYIIFEWADGGNLHELWQSDPSQPVTGTLVREAITQLHGLATALSAAHYLASDRAHGRSYRHGDLKPANILRFDSGTVIGTLKIGDWGEAKSHQTVTAMRNMDTTARYGTRRYEPPECEIGIGPTDLNQRAKGRSRLYDIWSMGCITLEFIIWLLYGATGLREFNDSVTTGSGDQSPFYEVNEACGVRSARVHSVVASWMQHMSKDPACRAGETALGDLLELVERGLLAVNLPSHGGSKDLLLIHDVRTERILDLVIPDRTSRPRDWISHTEFEGVPMINVTQPDEVEPSKADSLAIHIEQPVRYRADELCDRLGQIVSRHAEGNYWYMPRELPLPGATWAHCSTQARLTHGDSKQRPQSRRSCGAQTKANIRVHRRQSVKVDYANTKLSLEFQATRVKDDSDEACFTTKGRPRGSKNKRTTQTTRDSTKTSYSTSSRSQPSNRKRPRIDRDGDDEQGEQDGNEESPCLKDPKDSLTTYNLVCPFARYRPVEYPQCRIKQYRDIAKIKSVSQWQVVHPARLTQFYREHLRERHQRYCARCGEAFHTERAKDEHLRQDDMCTKKSVAQVESSLTFMKKEQESSISNEHGLSWFRMYEIMFPGPVPGDSCKFGFACYLHWRVNS
jgi:serine/threonine protein kinase